MNEERSTKEIVVGKFLLVLTSMEQTRCLHLLVRNMILEEVKSTKHYGEAAGLEEQTTSTKKHRRMGYDIVIELLGSRVDMLTL